MGLITYPFSLTAHTDAKASEVMANFNAVATVLNGGITIDNLASGMPLSAGKVKYSAPLTLVADVYTLIPGTELAIDVKEDAILAVVGSIEGLLGGSPAFPAGRVKIDGVAQTSSGLIFGASVPVLGLAEVSAGSRVVKLEAFRSSFSAETGAVLGSYLYFLLPR